MPAAEQEPSPAPSVPVGGRRGVARRVAGALAIGGLVLGTAAVGVWAAAPGVVAAATARTVHPGTASTGSAATGRRHPGAAGNAAGTSGGRGQAVDRTSAGLPGDQATGQAGAQATGRAGTGQGSDGPVPVNQASGATPVTPTVPVAPAAPPTPSAPAVPSPAPAPTATRGILPPDNPPANIVPDPDFLTVCSGTAPDSSAACTQAALAAIDNGRAAEGLGPMVLPTDWATLTPAEQLFVATNLERTARGLAPLTGLDPSLDQASATGAADGSDPAPPAGYPYAVWAANWAGALGNPLEAIDLWMYDDGPGSANVDCPTAGASGCWGHRDNILVSLSCQSCAMGTALDPTGWNGDPAWAELLVESQDPVSLVFTWSDVTPYLPADEG